MLRQVKMMEAQSVEPLRGIATSAGPVPGLYPLTEAQTDLSELRAAAQDHLAGLSDLERAQGTFPLDHPSWRQWGNPVVAFLRHGLCLADLDELKRQRALEVVRRSLSERGFREVLDFMRLSRTMGEIIDDVDQVNEWLYWFNVYGDPTSGAWGWQLDGHHVNIHCVIVGGQVVLAPVFLGAEPRHAEIGRYAGTRVLDLEEAAGSAFFHSLSAQQQQAATIAQKLPIDVYSAVLLDNLVLDYEGIRWDALSDRQRADLLEVLQIYIGRLRDDLAAAQMEKIRSHLDETWFAWIGDPDGVFYYRIHSPVVLVEFIHQPGVMFDNDYPTRSHAHTIVRCPNGNDYGHDWLRQYALDHPLREDSSNLRWGEPIRKPEPAREREVGS